MAKFSVPQVWDNPEGWGPTEEPEHLRNVPYAPFSKGEKLGKVADFTAPGNQKTHHGRTHHPAAPFVFQFMHKEEEGNFHLVDSRPVKPTGYRQPGAAARRQQQQQRNRREEGRDGGRHPQQHHQQQRRQYVQPGQKHNWSYRRDPPKQTVVYSSSIEVRPEWRVMEEMEFSSLNRLAPEKIPKPVDLYLCGQVEYCDRSYDHCTPKMEKPIARSRRVFRNVTTSDDPIMRSSLHEKWKEGIVSAIMCATHSVYSWDIVITKVGDKIFFDRRDQSATSFLTINETAPDQVQEDKDSINGVQQLSIEGTVANQYFSQQILKKGQYCRFKNPSPFPVTDGSSELASCAYKYRKWSMREGAVDVIVRCEVDAAQEASGRPQLVTTKALVEYCQKQGSHIDWRQRLESQRGAVFATERKNNSNKIARWTVAALLASTDLFKLGYVSRVSQKDNQRHAVLAVQVFKPQELAQQCGLKMEQCWAMLMKIVDLCMAGDDGKYLLLKEPNRPKLRLFEIPGDSL